MALSLTRRSPRPGRTLLIGLALAAFVGAGCDPGATVMVRNKTDDDYIVAWTKPGQNGIDSAVVPAGSEGEAYSMLGDEVNDWQFLLMTPECRIVGYVLASPGENTSIVYLEILEDARRADDPANIQSDEGPMDLRQRFTRPSPCTP